MFDQLVSRYLSSLFSSSRERDLARQRPSAKDLDPLTGMENRAAFLKRVNASLKAWRKSGDNSSIAILVLDLDRHRLVSDTLGSSAGDSLVNGVATRLRKALRPTDFVGRIGDDIFALCLTGLAQSEHAQLVAERVREAVSKPLWIAETHFHVSASFGLALAHQGSNDPDKLVSNASAACYRARKQGPGQIDIYSDKLHVQLSQDLALDSMLREAISNGELEAWFQPLVSLDGYATMGFETLARWKHPVLGQISPGKFIPLAESNGLIKPLGQLMLTKSLSQLAVWRLQGNHNLFVSVNVSASQLEEGGFVTTIASQLERYSLPPDCLHLEITESALVSNPAKARVALEMLRDLGVKISLDDFGTGYSAFSSLHQFPIHTLKIDRSLLPPKGEPGRQRQLFESICALAHGMGLEMVVEGIEDKEQAALAARASRGLGQGFLWSKALPPDEATLWLNRAAAPQN